MINFYKTSAPQTIENICVSFPQEYLKEEGGLSAEAVRMIGDLLNEQSLMHLALTEMIYIQSDVSDNTKYDWLHVCAFTFVLNNVLFSFKAGV